MPFSPRSTPLMLAVALSLGGSLPAAAEPAHTPVTDAMLLGAAQEANNWLMAGRDYAGTRYSPLARINTKSVKREKLLRQNCILPLEFQVLYNILLG